ncbi:MAG: putative Ig domain-containing protein, partial [Planctomycetes bacterium]|nr:putative Ig domain-containing protein [Planctomycetota bacterium]
SQVNETRRLAKYSVEALQRSATVRPDSVNFSDRTPELAAKTFKNSRVETLNAPRALVSGLQINNTDIVGGQASNWNISEFFSGAELSYSSTAIGTPNLTINASTGVISGTPLVGEGGNTYNFTVTATKKSGSVSVNLRIIVQ